MPSTAPPAEASAQLNREASTDSHIESIVSLSRRMLADVLKLTKDFGAEVRAYFERLREHPSFQRALAVQERAFTEQGIDPATRVG